MSPRIIYIMGVSGSGKTTVGLELSEATGIPFFDADDYHSTANKEKMKAGHPLDDTDRQGWLEALNNLARQEAKKAGAIIACSALKEKYRTILSNGIEEQVYWVVLDGAFEIIQERLKSRKEHFMPASLLQSQFDILEIPAGAMLADINHPPAKIAAEIRTWLDKLG